MSPRDRKTPPPEPIDTNHANDMFNEVVGLPAATRHVAGTSAGNGDAAVSSAELSTFVATSASIYSPTPNRPAGLDASSLSADPNFDYPMNTAAANVYTPSPAQLEARDSVFAPSPVVAAASALSAAAATRAAEETSFDYPLNTAAANIYTPSPAQLQARNELLASSPPISAPTATVVNSPGKKSNAAALPSSAPSLPNQADLLTEDDLRSTNETEEEEEEEFLSDAPLIKRQQMNAGYRDGLAASKADVMQAAFDSMFPLGAELGWHVGRILGVFEGYLACRSVGVVEGLSEAVEKTYALAQRELSPSSLLSLIPESILSLSSSTPPSTSGGGGALDQLHLTDPSLSLLRKRLSYWSGVAYGAQLTRDASVEAEREENGEAWRERVEIAKRERGWLPGDSSAEGEGEGEGKGRERYGVQGNWMGRVDLERRVW